MHSDNNSIQYTFGLFLISCAILLLELTQARVFSVMLWHHLSYMVITVALLGFGCAGSIIYLFWKQFSRNSDSWPAVLCCCFSVSTTVSFYVATRLPPCTLQFSVANMALIFLYYLLFFLPYVAGGAAVTLALSSAASRIHTYYCVNMVGSGLGCLLMVMLIGPLGGEAAIAAASLLGAVAALFFARGGKKIYGAVLTVLATIVVIYAGRIMPVPPAPFKALSVYENNREQFPGYRVEYSRWNAVSRIDVISADRTIGHTTVLPLHGKNKNLLVDGDAYTAIEKHPDKQYIHKGRPSFHMYTIPYLIAKKPKVLIIGLGGGNEVFTAQLMGASDITGCELNSITTDLIRNRYASFVGNLYQKPNTRIFTAEGRSFIRRSPEKYDLIQMTSVDTWAGLSSGAYVLSENYLYTLDAFQDYLEHLTDNGLLCITRLLFNPPREVLRLVSTAALALQQQGIDQPGAHMAILSVNNGGLAAVLIKKSPFTQEELATLINDRYYDPNARVLYAGHTPLPELNPMLEHGVPDIKGQARPFHDFFSAFRKNTYLDFCSAYPFDITPVTDDSPFFFEFYRWKRFFSDFSGTGTGGWGGDTIRPVALFILGAALLQALFFSCLFIIGPLLLSKRRQSRAGGKAPLLAYFFCLGLGYMMLEVVSMQKFVLFLGHPMYSIAVVLSAFLIFSGLGSLWAGRLHSAPAKTVGIAIGAIIAYGLLVIFAQQPIINFFLGSPLIVRISITCLLLFPLAFLMGIPFPAGLLQTKSQDAGLVPWAIGTNACASVTASVAAIVLAMGTGFTITGLAGLGVYCLGYLFFLRIPHKSYKNTAEGRYNRKKILH